MKSFSLTEWVTRGLLLIEGSFHSAAVLGCVGSRGVGKTKREVCLILHRVPWGQGVSLLPSWRLWVLYNGVHKGPASHSPVINKWAVVEAEHERGLPLSCHHTCFHIHRASVLQHEGWLAVSRTPGKASSLSSLVCLIIQQFLTTVYSSRAKKKNNNTWILPLCHLRRRHLTHG